MIEDHNLFAMKRSYSARRGLPPASLDDALVRLPIVRHERISIQRSDLLEVQRAEATRLGVDDPFDRREHALAVTFVEGAQAIYGRWVVS